MSTLQGIFVSLIYCFFNKEVTFTHLCAMLIVKVFTYPVLKFYAYFDHEALKLIQLIE